VITAQVSAAAGICSVNMDKDYPCGMHTLCSNASRNCWRCVHTFVTLAIAALACNDVAIFEKEQCRKERISLHMDFLMFENRAVFSSFSLQEVAWEHELGRGCVGVIRKAGLRGRPAAVKSQT